MFLLYSECCVRVFCFVHPAADGIPAVAVNATGDALQLLLASLLWLLRIYSLHVVETGQANEKEVGPSSVDCLPPE
jgi:hypothetical protein